MHCMTAVGGGSQPDGLPCRSSRLFVNFIVGVNGIMWLEKRADVPASVGSVGLQPAQVHMFPKRVVGRFSSQ